MNTQTTAPLPKLFIGMDIHKKSWSVHFRTDLFDYKGFTMPPSTDKLYSYVAEHFPDHEVSLSYEAGCCGFWAARYFLNLGWTVKVVNPADIPRSDKQHYQKTDKLLVAATFVSNYRMTASRLSTFPQKHRKASEAYCAIGLK